ncbi:uncharacterized protein ACIQIH_016146 [Cyanocitta cristata]
MGWNMARKDTGQKGMGWNMGRSDVGQKGMGWNMGRKDMGQYLRWSDTGQSDVGQDDMGQDDTGQIKDEEIKTSIPKAEALPSPLDVPPEMTNVGETKDGGIKDEEITISISKAPPHVQRKSADGSFTASGMHPGAPGIHLPAQRVQSVRGHPGSQTLWVPSESVPGTSRTLLKVPSSEYSPCDSVVQMSGRYSETILSTPPVSPGLSGHLPHGLKQVQVQEDREQAAERYSRRSPRYCGGQHTSTCPVQPMEPLLPDPNKPGAFDLVGRDGLVYRGRTPVGMD